MPTSMPEAVEAPSHLVPLPLLQAGESGCVGEITGASGLVHRLREMGLRAGASVRVIRGGSPCVFRLDGQKLCVRAEEVAGVLVRVAATA
jgi:Fe2+ transport system protein FeoA